MGSDAVSSPPGRRGARAALVVLWLAGGLGLGFGAHGVIASSGRSLLALAEIGLGGLGFLGGGFYLVPAAFPADAPSPTPPPPTRASDPVRPAPAGLRATGSKRVADPPAIPRWADPMVHPRIAEPVRPSGGRGTPGVAAAPAPSVPAPLPPSRGSAPPAPARPPTTLTALREADLFEGLPDPEDLDRPGSSETPDERLTFDEPASGEEILRELDRIEAELKGFQPIEIEAHAPSGAPALERST